MQLPLLALQNISMTFGVVPLLSGAALTVAAGDRICLIGRNGSGKSTLLCRAVQIQATRRRKNRPPRRSLAQNARH